MARSIPLKICLYNMHGYNHGLPMVRDLCLNYDIILLQEHWLLKDNLCKLSAGDTNFDFLGLSSMSDKLRKVF